jgi:hypothetical protein
MIPRNCKRLAEVDFPIAAVSRHAAREKSIRHGHPSTLHLWWARRPLAACRAMLIALLLPDPLDSLCPSDFKEKARDLLRGVLGRTGRSDESLREALLRFIGEFANWDNSANKTFLEIGRGLVQAAYPNERPLVVDPFAGGGSIPLEALRLGCETFASDLNPVACLILKSLLEDIPRCGPDLADDLRRVGKEIKAAAEMELIQFYPSDPDGARPIAYLWRALSVVSPLAAVRKFRLSVLCGFLRNQTEDGHFDPKSLVIPAIPRASNLKSSSPRTRRTYPPAPWRGRKLHASHATRFFRLIAYGHNSLPSMGERTFCLTRKGTE